MCSPNKCCRNAIDFSSISEIVCRKKLYSYYLHMYCYVCSNLYTALVWFPYYWCTKFKKKNGSQLKNAAVVFFSWTDFCVVRSLVTSINCLHQSKLTMNYKHFFIFLYCTSTLYVIVSSNHRRFKRFRRPGRRFRSLGLHRRTKVHFKGEALFFVVVGYSSILLKRYCRLFV